MSRPCQAKLLLIATGWAIGYRFPRRDPTSPEAKSDQFLLPNLGEEIFVIEQRQRITMKRRTIVAAAVALLMTSSTAWAICLEVFPPDTLKMRPEITCVSLTEQLLVSLKGSTKAQVIEAMNANGRMVDTQLRFVTVYTGDVDFTFENDKVVLIYAWGLDDAGGGDFIWNESTGYTCSDLPGSRYARCNKK
jgi:hypothetical protein